MVFCYGSTSRPIECGYEQLGNLIAVGNVKWKISTAVKTMLVKPIIKHRITIWASNSTSGYKPEITKNKVEHEQIDICTPMFIAKKWKQPFTYQWMNS